MTGRTADALRVTVLTGERDTCHHEPLFAPLLEENVTGGPIVRGDWEIVLPEGGEGEKSL
ncbi:hypothetical protein [Streptomyces sp. 142MFCol3.1]|uniref:hypothetical protein n=1 Tax=Streptomyces sp. 142MFCol3.1 TaxID=1172179 RepID=UPI0003FFD459|nr:hypothetical protein [Streptomyces sp. 142MFCol3.1]